MIDDEVDDVFPLEQYHCNDKQSPNNRKIAKLSIDHPTHINKNNPLASPIQLGTTPIHIGSIPDIDTSIDTTYKSEPTTINDFVLLKVIGRGAYGKVFQAYKKHNGTVYAIKVLKKYELIDRNVYNNIISERDVLQSVSHPFIVRLDSAFQSQTKLYLVLEYCGGGELFTYLDEKKELNENETCFYSAQVLSALSYLHSLDILYRDLKPENILINYDGYIQLTDFGFAKRYINTQQSTSFVGTVQYMAPEIVQKIGHSKTADYWALGILIYEMLTGKTPFDNNNRKKVQYNIIHAPLRLPRYISKHAVSLLDGLLCKDPKERLGAHGVEDIKQHRFFEHIDWCALEEKRIKPPFIPQPNKSKSNKNSTVNTTERADTSRFDKQFTDEKVIDSPLDAHYIDKADTFKGFSYTRDFTPHDYQYRQLHTPITNTSINNTDDNKQSIFTFSTINNTQKSHQPHDFGQPMHGSLARTDSSGLMLSNTNSDHNNNNELHLSTASTLTDISEREANETTTATDNSILTPSISTASLNSMVAGTTNMTLDSSNNTNTTSVTTTPHALKKSASSSLSLQLAAMRSSPTQRDGSTPVQFNTPTQSPTDRLHTSQSSNDIVTQRKLIAQLASLPVDTRTNTAQQSNNIPSTSTSAWSRPLTATLASTTANKPITSAAKAIAINVSPSLRNNTNNKPFNHHKSTSQNIDIDDLRGNDDDNDDDDEWHTVSNNKQNRNWKWK